MKKILLILEGPEALARMQANLAGEGYLPIGSHLGEGAVELCRRERPGLVVLDTRLRDADGLEICRNLRADFELARVPIILLTPRASDTDRIVGLELGADDCLAKPFSWRELLARIRVQLRAPIEPARVFRVGPLELDEGRCEARVEGRPVVLTPTEFKLLRQLMARPGAVFSRVQLLDAIWGSNRTVGPHTVNVYILRLRRKMRSPSGGHSCIRCVRGFGYSIATD